ncbi:DUF4352 domain-containing protein [Halomicrococcus sp. NG-SE-24]|uniref:DUF4352 domain-containing protein n=1 Tax=Halomicrococcus sp. NG-SE-24 TaxID=3436928 RepID=UPI003D9763C0
MGGVELPWYAMKRRKFIAGIAVGAGTLLAGCSNESDSTTTTTETSGTETTATNATTSASGTTTEAETTTTGTDQSETTTETTSTTSVQSVSYKQYVDLQNGLRTAVTDAQVTDSYEQGGEKQTSSDGNKFLVVQFTTKNSGQSAQSLPDDAMSSVQTSDGSYELVSSSRSAWKQYRSSSVEAGASAKQTVAFEVPEEAASSLGVSVELTYSASGERRVVRWSME